MKIEIEREKDGRWIAEVLQDKGVHTAFSQSLRISKKPTPNLVQVHRPVGRARQRRQVQHPYHRFIDAKELSHFYQ